MRNVLRILVSLSVVGGVTLLAWKRLDEHSGTRAEDAPAARPPVAVRAVRAEKRGIEAFVYGQGTARAVRREFLTFESAGRVTFLKEVDGRSLREGDRVTKDEVLAQVDDREAQEQVHVSEASLTEAQEQEKASRASVDSAKAACDLALADLRRSKELLDAGSAPRSEYEIYEAKAKNAEAQVRSAEAQVRATASTVAATSARLTQARLWLERTRIRAPFDGILAYLNVGKGDYFSLSMIATSSEQDLLSSCPMVVLDPSAYEVTIEVPSFDGSRVASGQPAWIVVGQDLSDAALAGADGLEPKATEGPRGAVYSVNPAISPGGRSMEVKIRTTQGSERLLDGMFVSCWIVVESKAEAVVVPQDAFVYRDSRPAVFVVDASGRRVEERMVKLGIDGLTATEILVGVQPGELVVTEGRHRLVSGTTVEVLGQE